MCKQSRKTGCSLDKEEDRGKRKKEKGKRKKERKEEDSFTARKQQIGHFLGLHWWCRL
jgi:hypothetical protein